MKKVGILFLLISVLLYGCNQSKEEAKNSLSKKQFVEVIDQNDVFVGIMEETGKIKYFIEQLDMKSWEYDVELTGEAELIYNFVFYEVVDDEILKKGEKPYVVKSSMSLYRQKKEYFVAMDEMMSQISENSGVYMSAPEKMDLETTRRAQAILNEWSLPIKDIDNEKDADSEGEKADVYTEKDVRAVSKEQKIEICNEMGKVVYSTSDISTITDILNATNSSNWKEVDGRPNDIQKMCTLKKYSLKRKQIKKNLVIDYSDILYFSGDKYYVERTIQNDNENSDYIEYYEVSKETADYINSFF